MEPVTGIGQTGKVAQLWSCAVGFVINHGVVDELDECLEWNETRLMGPVTGIGQTGKVTQLWSCAVGIVINHGVVDELDECLMFGME